MKAKRQRKKNRFTPLVLTLESQEEIDAIFMLVNSMNICEVFPVLDNWFSELDKYADYDHDEWNKLDDILV